MTLKEGTKFEVAKPIKGEVLHVRWGGRSGPCEHARSVPPGRYEVASVGHGTATLHLLLDGDVRSGKHSYVVGTEALRNALREGP